MAEVKVNTGSHMGHTHFECDACNQWFETGKELMEHGAKVHPQQVAAM